MAGNKSIVKRKIIGVVDAMAGQLKAVSKYLFDNPETCYRERLAVEYLTEKFRVAGFGVTSPYGGVKTAFKAVSKGGGASGPTVALIAEYDALAGLGHACGHNLIAASAYGAAVAIRESAPNHPGQLAVIGTPAEEGGGGKIRLLKNNAFADVNAAIMAHPSNKTRIVSRMYAITSLEFTFIGQSAHAAAFPDQGINALDAGVLFYNAVAAMRQQLRDEARVHGIFTNGGEAPNIIPERVVMNFYVRALDRDYFSTLVNKVKQCARGAAKASACRVKIRRLEHVYEPFYPNRAIGEVFRANMEFLGIREDDFGETEEIGSSDIGNLSQILPTLHPEYAVGARSDINHSRAFLKAVTSAKGIDAMLGMTKALAMTALDLLTDKKLMTKVQSQFRAGGTR